MRGQISLFIIIGLFILLMSTIALYVLNLKQEYDSDKPVDIVSEVYDISAIKANIKYCVDQQTERALYLTGIQGGYAHISDSPTHLSIPPDNAVAYGYMNPDKLLITEEEMKSQISKYILDNLPVCIDDFRTFKMQGYVIEDSPISSEVEFSDSGVKMTVDYPVKIKRGTSDHIIKPTKAFYPVRILGIFTASDKIIEKIYNEGNTELIDIVFLNGLGYEIEILPLTTGDVLYKLTDSNTDLFDKHYEFWFVVR